MFLLLSTPSAASPGHHTMQADIYSAGVLLYLLLTGKWPYNGVVGSLLNRSLGKDGVVQGTLVQKMNRLETQDVFKAVREEELDFSEETWRGISPDALSLVVRCAPPPPHRPLPSPPAWRRVGLHGSVAWVLDTPCTWRVPEYEELKTVSETRCENPAYNTNAFPGLPVENFWTSTTQIGSLWQGCSVYTHTGHGHCRTRKVEPMMFMLVSDP